MMETASVMEHRGAWVQLAVRLAEPVFSRISEGRLAAEILYELPYGGMQRKVHGKRRLKTHVEAFVRCLDGLAPWFALTSDDARWQATKERLVSQARRGLASEHTFWTCSTQDWDAKTIWEAKDRHCDTHLAHHM